MFRDNRSVKEKAYKQNTHMTIRKFLLVPQQKKHPAIAMSLKTEEKITDVHVSHEDTATKLTCILKNETHTIGGLLKTYLNQRKDVTYAAYGTVHPLLHDISVELHVLPSNDPYEILQQTLKDIASTVTTLGSAFDNALQQFHNTKQ